MEKIEKQKRLDYLKKELEDSMPSIMTALGMGFYPANYKMLETMAQEFFQLKKELDMTLQESKQE